MTVPPCEVCNGPLTPGEALRATVTVGGAAFALHRPSLRPGCLPAVGTAFQVTIALWDPEAARRYDSQWSRPVALEAAASLDVFR